MKSRVPTSPLPAPVLGLALAALLGGACASPLAREADSASPPDPRPVTRPVPGRLPPPPSALPGATAVWSEIQEACGDRVRLRALKSTTVPGQDDRPDRIHVRVDLVLVGDDALEATARYGALIDALSKAPWCENVQRAATGNFDSGKALGVHDLKILYRPAESDWSPGQVDEDPAVTASSLAAEAGFGALESRQLRRRQPGAGVVSTFHGFRPADDERSFALASILGFAEELEDQTANLSITRLDLRSQQRSRSTVPSDAWTFELELTSRAGEDR